MAESILQKQVGLADLLDLPSFTEVCKSFCELYRVGIKVFDSNGTRLVDIAVGSGDFCGYIFSRNPGRQMCTDAVTRVKNRPLEEPGHCVDNCFSGCRFIVTPIFYQGDYLGRIVFGPYLPDELPELSVHLGERAGDYDLARLTEYAQKIRRAPDATVKRVLDHFGKIVDVMVFTSQKALLTTQLHIESVTESYRELQEKNRKLADSYERLKELDRLKSNFLATVSHELRTPLTSVIGYSEMLLAGLAGEMNPEQREYIQTILEKGESLLNLITSILDISKIEARGVKLVTSDTDLGEIVKSAVSTITPQARKKQLTVSDEVSPEMPRAVVDAEKVRQCLVNLLSNAVKFTPPGGKIMVRARPANHAPPGSGPFGKAGWVELEVQDTGAGIPVDQRERIFETFYQVDNSSTREYGGAGLGLSIVRSYVEAHGGEVRVDSEIGKGSTFTLLLPVELHAMPAASGGGG